MCNFTNKKVKDIENVIFNENWKENDFIRAVGIYIDEANKLQQLDKIQIAIEQLVKFADKIKEQSNKCLYHYFLSVAYGDVRKLTISGTSKDWDWEQEIKESELLNLRLAYKYVSGTTDSLTISNIFTNLGNSFNNIGRFILSFDFWNKAIINDSEAGMPFVNMGNAMMYHGLNSIKIKKYQIAYIQLALQYFEKGLGLKLYPNVREEVKEIILKIKINYQDALNVKFHKDDFVSEDSDTEYVNWCTDNRLYLNPLSNINPAMFSNLDDITVESPNKEICEIFDDVKKDYLFCRKQFFQSIVLSDIEEAEQLRKSSFKNAYSIFDQISYLLGNALNIEEKASNRLNFSRIWYTKLERNKGVKSEFSESRNLMLRALFWCSKDIYLNEDGFKNILEPKAKEINKIRNFIEHRSFRFGPRSETDITFQMPIEDFDLNMFKLLELARECLIYTAYSIRNRDQ